MQRLLIALLCLTLISCGKKTTTIGDSDSINNANYYLSLARDNAQPQKSEYLLKAGIILAQKAQYLKAQETLSFLNPEFLNQTDRESYFLFYGYSLQKLEQHEAASRFFKRIETPNQHDIDWQILYIESMSYAYLQEGNYFESAKLRIEMEDLLLDQQKVADNHQFIWTALSYINEEFLLQYQTSFTNPILNGWLEIAYITRKHTSSPANLLATFNLWKQKYPLHPANVQMPDELKNISNAQLYQPRKLALLLPLSGNFANVGRMIRDGFFAAHYSRINAEELTIKVYDTEQTLTPMVAYQNALSDQVDFIVGPLTKDAVNEIAAQESLSIPHLTLNRSDIPPLSSNTFYQFGLPIEDEARQIAELAIDKNHKIAIVLAPESGQGDRTVETFTQTFESFGGKVAEIQRYSKPEELKIIIQRLLNIDISEQRSRKIQQILGEPVEFVQRRRQDVDMVFLASPARDARQVKPFLNYYFAHDLPVYAVSRINSGSQEQRLNNDLNGIMFTDSPFLISGKGDLDSVRQNLAQVIPQINSAYGRFFALGFDAYRLVPDLQVLKAFKQYQIEGLSGLLSVNDQGEVERQLSIAQFKNGIAHEVTEQTSETKR